MNTSTPDDAPLDTPIPEPSLPKIVIHVTECTIPEDDMQKFLRDLAQTIAAETRGIVKAKCPKGEIRLVVTLQ